MNTEGLEALSIVDTSTAHQQKRLTETSKIKKLLKVNKGLTKGIPSFTDDE
jgi:hypothetical protein